MIRNSEMIIDESGIEMIVGYRYDKSPSQMEQGHGHGDHEVGQMVYTELESVEVVIKGTGIDILPRLNEKQKDYIIEQLNYD